MKRGYFIPLAAGLAAVSLLGAGCESAVKLKEKANVTVETEKTAPASSTAQESGREPVTIEVKNQALANDKIMINEVNAPEQGWLVIHQSVDGKAGAVIGETAVVKGQNKTLTVSVDKTKVSAELIAMLHSDAGAIGTYEPASDTPMTNSAGAVIMVKFEVVNFAKAEAEEKKSEKATDNKPAPLPEAQVKVDLDLKAIPSAPAVKDFSLTAKQWEFSPATITVKKGDTVRLKITSTDVSHGFSLPEFKVRVNLEPGQTQTVEFVASQAGTFTFSCSVFCGDGHGGMKGTLIVTE